MDAFVIDEVNRRALSYRWQYDHVCCRWQQITSSSGVTSSPNALYRSLSAVSASANGELGSLSPSLADIDTGNHVTSGYESETTSPTNDQMLTSSSDVSPLTSLSSTRSSDRSIPDSSLPLNMTCSSTPVAADMGGLIIMRPRRSTAEIMLPRTVSYYDNLIQSETVLADPQTELETILDDLRRNISALDAALAASSSTTTTPSTPGQHNLQTGVKSIKRLYNLIIQLNFIWYLSAIIFLMFCTIRSLITHSINCVELTRI